MPQRIMLIMSLSLSLIMTGCSVIDAFIGQHDVVNEASSPTVLPQVTSQAVTSPNMTDEQLMNSPILPPQNLAVATHDEGLRVTWYDAGIFVQEYRVYRYDGDTPFVIATVMVDQSGDGTYSYVDRGAPADATYTVSAMSYGDVESQLPPPVHIGDE